MYFGHSVVAIFAFNTIDNKYLKMKSRLYCCFVAYKQAFDTVDRVKLWHKIVNLGLKGKR